MRRVSILVAFAALAVLLLSSPRGAGADGPDYSPKAVQALLAQLQASPDPASAFVALPPRAQEAVKEALQVVEVTTDSQREMATTAGGVAPLGVSCWTWTISRYGKNALGQNLWGYKQRIDWCINGLYVTQVSAHYSWGEVYFPFWQYNGVISWWESGGVGYRTFERWSQGKFALCIPSVGCGQYRYPWIDMWVSGDNRYGSSQGG